MPQSSRRSGTSFLGYGPAGRRPCLQPRSCQPDTCGWQMLGLPGCRRRPSACGRGFFCRTMTGGGTFRGLAPGAEAERAPSETAGAIGGAAAAWTEKHEAEARHQRLERQERACAATEERTAAEGAASAEARAAFRTAERGRAAGRAVQARRKQRAHAIPAAKPIHGACVFVAGTARRELDHPRVRGHASAARTVFEKSTSDMRHPSSWSRIQRRQEIATGWSRPCLAGRSARRATLPQGPAPCCCCSARCDCHGSCLFLLAARPSTGLCST